MLPGCEFSGLELVRRHIALRAPAGRSDEALMAAKLVDGGRVRQKHDVARQQTTDVER
jgi:hypothetical protein